MKEVKKNNQAPTILITGAYGGMGRAAATLLRQKGYRVFALDLRTEEQEDGIIPIEADVTSEQSVLTAAQKVKGLTDHLDAILHFAGIYMLDSLVEMESQEFEKILAVNLSGAFLVNKSFLPLLKKGGRIVITTSELAPLDPLPFTGIYAVTKGALDKYAYSLRMELQLLDIKVSVLRAGAVGTDMLNVSTDALDRFCRDTGLYKCNADRFKRIVCGVEARQVPPEKVAQKVFGILQKANPKFAYTLNRNPLLLLLNALPSRLQFFIIRKILK